MDLSEQFREKRENQTERDNEKGSREERGAQLPPPLCSHCHARVFVGVLDRRDGLFMGRLIAFMALFLPVNGAGCFNEHPRCLPASPACHAIHAAAFQSVAGL